MWRWGDKYIYGWVNDGVHYGDRNYGDRIIDIQDDDDSVGQRKSALSVNQGAVDKDYLLYKTILL